ncbi:MAG: hypothetical protein JW837_12315 [Sedimentisphaerales bacterium]|nr:hypothetical protein [Sedimentisphaerales bacterium]
MGEKRTSSNTSYYSICFFFFMLTFCLAANPVRSASIPIENASFEGPFVDPNGFPAVPIVDGWTEIDIDPVASSNTGVFANTPKGNDDHVVNAEGNQLAFLGSETGNGLEQDLNATYKAGCDYRLTVGVSVSMRFPPSSIEPADALELVLFYRDSNDVVDIASKKIEAIGLSSSKLMDFSLELPIVKSGDAWAGKTIGIALRAAGMPGGFWDMDNVRLVESQPVSIKIENASFEAPFVDPNAFPALPFIEAWTETDNDPLGSTNTGVFANTPGGKTDHIVNPDGRQLVFLGSESGNGLSQELNAKYTIGCDYRLSVLVGISSRFPPSIVEPADTVELVLFYRDANDAIVDIACKPVDAIGIFATQLVDFSLCLPTVQSDDAWAGKAIGIGLRAAGMPGGFWDLDNVRLVESMPVSISIENASFEAPYVDPNAFPALPLIDAWVETDNDELGSTNTGVFANTPGGKTDHIFNPDGRQLVFLGSESGNGLEQELNAAYKAGCNYRLTVSVGISSRFPPSIVEPADTVEMVLFYRDDNSATVDIASETVDAIGIFAQNLVDFSLYLPTVQPDDAWAGKAIGIGLRAVGMPGGFWDIDYVRLAESLPE